MEPSHPDELSKLEALYAQRPESRVFTHLAEAYRVAGEVELAREVVAAGLERHDDYPSAHVVHGRVLLEAGQDDEAEAAFHRVLELDRHNLAALRGLGDLARRGGRTDAALDHYRELLALDADEEVAALVDELESGEGETAGATTGEMAGTATGEMAGTATGETAGEVPLVDVADLDLESLAAGGDPAGGAGGADDPADAMEFELLDGFETLDPTAPDAASGEEADGRAYRGFAEDEAIGSGGDAPETVGAGADAAARDAAAVDEPRAADAVDGAPPVEDGVEPGFGEISVEEPGAGESGEADTGTGSGIDDLPLLVDPAEEVRGGEAADGAEPHEAAGLVTATMAELYARQGLYDRAAEVYRDLLARRPDDERLKERLADAEARAREAEAASPVDGEAAPEADAAIEAPTGGGAPAPDVDASGTAGAEPAAEGSGEPDWSAIEALAEELAGGRSPGGRGRAHAGRGRDEDAKAEATAEPHTVEAAWTAGAGVAGAEVTPYSWAEEPGTGAAESDEGPTLREYFRTLLEWTGPRPAESPGAPAEPIELEAASPADEFDRLFEGGRPAPAAADEPEAPPSPRASEPPPVGAGPARSPQPPPVGEGGAGPPPPPVSEEDAGDDDDDLEAFRAWLESLKR